VNCRALTRTNVITWNEQNRCASERRGSSAPIPPAHADVPPAPHGSVSSHLLHERATHAGGRCRSDLRPPTARSPNARCHIGGRAPPTCASRLPRTARGRLVHIGAHTAVAGQCSRVLEHRLGASGRRSPTWQLYDQVDLARLMLVGSAVARIDFRFQSSGSHRSIGNRAEQVIANDGTA
jgi:hypothetical protein